MRHRCAKILGQLDLPAGVACTSRDGQAAQTLRAEMDAQPSGKQAVAGHVLKNIVPAHPYHRHAAGHQIGPGMYVVLRMADRHRRSGRAAGAVHADNFRLRNAEQPGGILGAQVVLCGKGYAAQVVQTTDKTGAQTGGVQTLAIKGALSGLLYRAFQPESLDFRNMLPAPGFCQIKNFHRVFPCSNTISYLSRQGKSRAHYGQRSVAAPARACAHPHSKPKQPASIMSPCGARKWPCPRKRLRFGPVM